MTQMHMNSNRAGFIDAEGCVVDEMLPRYGSVPNTSTTSPVLYTP